MQFSATEWSVTKMLDIVKEPLLQHWKVLLASSLAIFVGAKWIQRIRQRQVLNSKIKAYRQRIAEVNQTLRERLMTEDGPGLITPKRKQILELPIQELLDAMRDSKLRPTEVLEAFQAQALNIHKAKNCICHFIVEASAWAKDLEALPADKRGPLYGLPVSVKECFQVKGYDSTVGLIRFINAPATEDGQFVAHLKRLGAVPFCLTNVPQTMKSLSCSNPIYGYTLHPMNDKRSPGGSSGGEACLISGRGSVLGIGTDVGGSLRVPAHFCGCVGIKPTSGRLYTRGRRLGSQGHIIGVHANTGFMSHTVDGCVIGMKSMLDDTDFMCEEDPTVIPLPWRESLFKPNRKLRIGWYDHDDVEASPACRRAVHEAVRLLREAGHHVEHFKPFAFKETFQLYFNHVLSDDGVNSLVWLENEIVDQAIEVNILVWRCAVWLRKYLAFPIANLVSPISAPLLHLGHRQSSDLWVSVAKLEDYFVKVLAEWRRRKIDTVIYPGFVTPAPFLKDPARLVGAIPTVSVNNLLGLPGGTLPITRVTGDDEEKGEGLPYEDKDRSHDLLYRISRNCHKGSAGLPVGVQVLGKPFEEELVLHVMKELEILRDAKKMFKSMDI